MTTRHPLVLVFLVIPLLAAPVRADVSEFTSYDECILESLKGVSSDVAANAIIASCRSKFPASTPGAVVPAEPAAAPAAEPEPEAAPEAADVEPAQTASEPKPAAGPSRSLTEDELRKLKATLFGFTTKYTVTFENFNDDIAITEVTIAVWDDFDPRGLKTYTETMHIPPSGSAKVAYEVVYMGDDQGWRWKVDSAKGVPVIN
jgi:hypothetical protein